MKKRNEINLDELLGKINSDSEDNAPKEEPVPEEPKWGMKPQAEVLACKSTLNEEQLKVFDALVDFLQSEEKYVSLIGYAGTGKTYTLSKFVEATTIKVAMTAPTNKAVKVLMDNRTIMEDRLVYTTIHKLLALKMQWVYPKPGQDFEPFQKLVPNRNGERSVRDYDLIIVDESSMLNDELFLMLDSELSRESSEWDDKPMKNTKIIFMGDPAQIPPVNEEDSIPLVDAKRSYYKMEAHFLERIMRQSGDNKILETAYQIRNNRFMPGDPILSRMSNKDVLFLSSASTKDQQMFFGEVKRHFASKEFAEDSNFCKVIAWTNAVVDKMNRFIRQSIFHTEDLKHLMEGEKLIADKPVIKNSNIIFNTSDEFEVISFEPKTLIWKIPNKKPKDKFLGFLEINAKDIPQEKNKNLFGVDVIQAEDSKGEIILHYWETVVAYKDVITKSINRQVIDILDDNSDKQLSWILSKLFKAKLFDDYTIWSERFAKVKYNYAITAHKSQGSTYGTVFLIEDDINKNKKIVERNRIKYTAATRPKKRLFLLSGLNLPLEEQLKNAKRQSSLGK